MTRSKNTSCTARRVKNCGPGGGAAGRRLAVACARGSLIATHPADGPPPTGRRPMFVLCLSSTERPGVDQPAVAPLSVKPPRDAQRADVALVNLAVVRSEERRVGKECGA